MLRFFAPLQLRGIEVRDTRPPQLVALDEIEHRRPRGLECGGVVRVWPVELLQAMCPRSNLRRLASHSSLIESGRRDRRVETPCPPG